MICHSSATPSTGPRTRLHRNRASTWAGMRQHLSSILGANQMSFKPTKTGRATRLWLLTKRAKRPGLCTPSMWSWPPPFVVSPSCPRCPAWTSSKVLFATLPLTIAQSTSLARRSAWLAPPHLASILLSTAPVVALTSPSCNGRQPISCRSNIPYHAFLEAMGSMHRATGATPKSMTESSSRLLSDLAKNLAAVTPKHSRILTGLCSKRSMLVV